MSVLLQEHLYLVDWPIDSATAVPVTCIRFQPAPIDAESFRSAGIDYPADIAAAVPKRQKEFFYGRLCARSAMAPLRRDVSHIGTGPMREPLWPAGLIGSITHAADMAAAVVLPVSLGYHGVGIDIESILGGQGAQEVRAIVANEVELRYLAGFDDTLGANGPLTLLFSAKESFFKAVHGEVRRYFNFDAIELEHIDLSTQRMRFRVCEDLTPRLRPGMRCDIRFKILDVTHIATLCLWRRETGHA
jgi:4'-phosphopantetheinyl transferase EntD